VAASVCGTIEALTRPLAVELAPIRANAVSPGVVRTNLWQNMSADEREQLFESVGKRLPVGRVGEAHDIAQAYLFLMRKGSVRGRQSWLMAERCWFNAAVISSQKEKDYEF
jgi:NAD(P)-dependent dehydrogenase (short-subunit alcohol dehydrogenase family)